MTTPVVAIAGSDAKTAEAAVAELGPALARAAPRVVFFFASPRHALGDVARGLTERFPGVPVVGCTTCGEIGPNGLGNGGITAFGLGAPARAVATLVDLEHFHFQEGGRVVAELQAALGVPRLEADKHVFVTLAEGLSSREEVLLASIGTYATGIPLVGGSAGDEFAFERTAVACGEATSASGCVVVLLEPNTPFHVFHRHHFHPTEQRMVVTRADPVRRRIFEIDGRPPLDVVARLLGTTAGALAAAPGIFANQGVAFAFRVGPHWCLRSVLTVEGGALVMAGGVEEGTVLRWMRPDQLVEATRDGLREAVLALGAGSGAPVAALLFNCAHRSAQAEYLGVKDELSAAIASVPSCGFTTYGEHFGPVQVNVTLTGLALVATPL